MPVKLGFGSTVPRFLTVGLYPELDRDLIREHNPKTAPTTYNPHKYVCKKNPKSDWDKNNKDARAEICSKQPSWCGPGHYNVPRNTFKRSLMPKGTMFTASKRSSVTRTDNNPGPGVYEPGIFKHSSVVLKQKNAIGSFEWDGFKDRFALPPANISSLPPNMYNPKDVGGLEHLLNKVVSARGPYDLFTGPRDGSTIKNHFTHMEGDGADIFYQLRDDLNYMLHNPLKKRCGAFSKEHVNKRVPCKKKHVHLTSCYVPHESPGPTTYDITWHEIKKAEYCKRCFGTSLRRHDVKSEGPGPGRYFLDYTKRKHARKKRQNLVVPPKPHSKRRRRKKFCWQT